MIRRPRRLRVTKQIRDLVHETSIDKTDLIYPMFIIDGETEDIPSMPNIKRYSLTDLPSALDEVVSAGVGAVLYFGIPKTKDEFGSEAYNEFGIVQRAIRLTKELYPNLIVIADICLCEYTSHGHCGVIEHDCIVNDKTLPLLAKASVACAKAGADIVAPSDMMDGRVGAIRQALDENRFENVLIMAYASNIHHHFTDRSATQPTVLRRLGTEKVIKWISEIKKRQLSKHSLTLTKVRT